MARCTVCGKKGLFLKINAYGQCKVCEAKFQEEERLKLQKEAEKRNLTEVDGRLRKTEVEEEHVASTNKKEIEIDVAVSNDVDETMLSESFDMVPDCVVTDIETSGLNYNKNSIIEIAAIKILNSKVVDTYSSFVHRDKALDGKITSLTGITTQMLRECDKDLDVVMSEYKEFVGDLPLVGHNIKSFDIKFINEAYLKIFGKEIMNLCIDTLPMSREHFYDENSHKLGDLAKVAGIPEGTQHRALGDCETTARLYRFMVDEAAFLLLRWCRKGKEIDETDAAYPKILKRQYPTGMCYKYHQKLIECGYLEEAGVSDILSTLTVSELKDILEKNSLSNTGSKAVLIDRIVNETNTKMLNLPMKYALSQKGVEYFENIIKKKNDKYFTYIENKQYGLARSEIFNISDIYKDLGNMKEYYFYLLCTFYHDMAGFNNGGWRDDRKDLMFAPAIIYDIEKKSKYYEENMVERCFAQYKLPSHYLTQSELSAALSKLFSEGAEAMKEMIING